MAGWLLSLVLVVLDRVQAQGQLSNIARRDRGNRCRVSPRDWCRPGARSHGPLGVVLFHSCDTLATTVVVWNILPRSCLVGERERCVSSVRALLAARVLLAQLRDRWSAHTIGRCW